MTGPARVITNRGESPACLWGQSYLAGFAADDVGVETQVTLEEVVTTRGLATPRVWNDAAIVAPATARIDKSIQLQLIENVH